MRSNERRPLLGRRAGLLRPQAHQAPTDRMPSPPRPLCGRPVSLYGHASIPYPDPHADPARAPLLLPDRLAPALGRNPVRARSGTLRGLRATARADGSPPRRRAMVGCGRGLLARQARAAGARPARCCGRPQDRAPDPGGSGRGPSRPRHRQQRRCQSRRLLPALPYHTRSARTPPTPLDDPVSPQGARRPVPRTLRLSAGGLDQCGTDPDRSRTTGMELIARYRRRDRAAAPSWGGRGGGRTA